MERRRCTGCDWIVNVDEDLLALAHGWQSIGECPGVGKLTEHPNLKNF